jgi:hypothetical protein
MTSRANDSITGNIWLEMHEESKFAIIMGYQQGISDGTYSGASEASHLYDTVNLADENIGEIIKSKEVKEKYQKFNAAIDKARARYSLRFSIKNVSEQMDYIYKEPAARIIPWHIVFRLAQKRLDGKDITEDISYHIKNKPWDLNKLLESFTPN